MSTPKPTLPAYSPGRATGYMVTAADYDNDVLQQGAWTQDRLAPRTSDLASPNSNDTEFRSDLGGYYRWNGTTWVHMGARVKIMEYNASTDVMSGLAISATTWTDVCANQSFTVDDALAPVEIGINIGAIVLSATANNEMAMAVLIDSTTRYVVSGNVSPAGSQYIGLPNAVMNIGTLTAAAHTVKVQIYTFAAATGYCRAGTNGPVEFLRIQVHENHP